MRPVMEEQIDSENNERKKKSTVEQTTEAMLVRKARKI